MNRFRLFEPCPKQEFMDRTGLPLTQIASRMQAAIQKELMADDGDVWRVTELGHRYLNVLLEGFMEP